MTKLSGEKVKYHERTRERANSKEQFLRYYKDKISVLLKKIKKNTEPRDAQSLIDHYNRQIVNLGGNS